MAVKTRNELMDFLKSRFEEDTSDEILNFLEDITDTFDDFESRLNDTEDWKTRYEENDREWREKYRDRFYSGPKEDIDVDVIDNDVDDERAYSYDELFEEKGDE